MVSSTAYQSNLLPFTNMMPFAKQQQQTFQQDSRLAYGYENNNDNYNINAYPSGNYEAARANDAIGDDENGRMYDEDEEGTSSQTGSFAESAHRQEPSTNNNHNSFVHYPEEANYMHHYQMQQQPQHQQQPQYSQAQSPTQFAAPVVNQHSVPNHTFQHQQSMPANFYSQQQQFDAQPNVGVGLSSTAEFDNSVYGNSGTGAATNNADEKHSNTNNNDSAMKKSGGFLRTLSNYLPQRLGGGAGSPTNDLIGGKGAVKTAKKMVLPADKNPQFVFENGAWTDKKNPQAHLAAQLAPPPPPAATNSGTSTPLSGAGMLSDFYRMGHPASSPNLRAMGGAPPGKPPSMPTLFGPPI